MKKIICSVFLVLTLLLVLVIPAFAGAFEEEYAVDFTKKYVKNKASNAVVLRYNPSNWFLPVRASTDVSIPSDGTGHAYTYMIAANQESTSSFSTTVKNGIINSGKAQVDGQRTAIRVDHVASRNLPLTYDHWEYDLFGNTYHIS